MSIDEPLFFLSPVPPARNAIDFYIKKPACWQAQKLFANTCARKRKKKRKSLLTILTSKVRKASSERVKGKLRLLFRLKRSYNPLFPLFCPACSRGPGWKKRYRHICVLVPPAFTTRASVKWIRKTGKRDNRCPLASPASDRAPSGSKGKRSCILLFVERDT